MDFQKQERKEDQIWQDYEDTIKMALTEIHGHKFHRHFDVILVDEGQDFAPNIFNLLRIMIKPGGYLFVCDDPMQSLWRQFDLKDKGLQNAQLKLLKLPLRTTSEIAEAAQSLFEMVPAIRTDDDNEIYPAQTSHLVSGDKPQLTVYANRKAERNAIMNCIQEQMRQDNPVSIAVLTPYFDQHWYNSLEDLDVYYGNFNRMKGLEFQTVYLAHLDEVFQNSWNERVIMRRWLYRKLFVAMTRARQNLHLSYIGELPDFIAPLKHYCATHDIQQAESVVRISNPVDLEAFPSH